MIEESREIKNRKKTTEKLIESKQINFKRSMKLINH